MSMYGAEPNRAEPDRVTTEFFSVRVPGRTAWQSGIRTFDDARESKRLALQSVGQRCAIFAHLSNGNVRLVEAAWISPPPPRRHFD